MSSEYRQGNEEYLWKVTSYSENQTCKWISNISGDDELWPVVWQMEDNIPPWIIRIQDLGRHQLTHDKLPLILEILWKCTYKRRFKANCSVFHDISWAYKVNNHFLVFVISPELSWLTAGTTAAPIPSSLPGPASQKKPSVRPMQPLTMEHSAEEIAPTSKVLQYYLGFLWN